MESNVIAQRVVCMQTGLTSQLSGLLGMNSEASLLPAQRGGFLTDQMEVIITSSPESVVGVK